MLIGAFILHICDFAYKPGSVEDGHLSSLIVANKLYGESRMPPMRSVGQTAARCADLNGVASDRVYSGPMLP